jgi:PAS domain S-box-containing protein
MQRPARSQRSIPASAAWIAFAVFATAFIGIALTRESGRIASIWLANAVVVVALLRTSRRQWPGWLVCGLAGNLAANLLAGDTSWLAMGLALCNSLEIFLAGWLFRVLDGGRTDLTKSRSLFRFICVAGAAAAAAGAIAAGTLRLDLGTPFWAVFRAWFAADALGLLIIVPAFAGAAGEFGEILRSPSRLEALAIAVLVPAVTASIVLGSHSPWFFLLGPLFLWATFRFGFVGVAMAIFLATASGIVTLVAVAPHTRQVLDLGQEISFLQLFLLANVLIFLPVANLLRSLRESEERFRLAMEVATDGIWDWNLATGQVYFSPSCARMVGFEPGEFPGSMEAWLARVAPEDRARVRDAKQRCADGLDSFEAEYRVETREGGSRWILGRGKAVRRDGHGRATRMVGNHLDFTERRRRDDELRQKTAEMERFTYMVSHDLKSPLVTVRTFLGYLERDLAEGKAERVAKDLDFMRSATGKMTHLLEDLLEVSRVGRAANVPVRVAFADLVQGALKTVGGAISAGQVSVTVAAPALTLFGDRPRLEQIWQNLVDNAVKYMGGQAAPLVALGAEEAPGETVFFVRDNGMGIDPRFQGKVFGLFEQLDPASEGTGLGLALVKRIVEQYGGRIWLESAGEGQGTCFRFTLPLAMEPHDDR